MKIIDVRTSRLWLIFPEILNFRNIYNPTGTVWTHGTSYLAAGLPKMIGSQPQSVLFSAEQCCAISSFMYHVPRSRASLWLLELTDMHCVRKNWD